MRISKGESIRPNLGAGVHEAKIKKLQLEYDVDTFYGKKDLFEITYQSTQGKPKTITQRYIAYYDESSTFGKVVKAVFGELPDDLNTNDLIGKPCKITVEPKRSKQNKLFYNVTKVEPSEGPSVETSEEPINQPPLSDAADTLFG